MFKYVSNRFIIYNIENCKGNVQSIVRLSYLSFDPYDIGIIITYIAYIIPYYNSYRNVYF